MLNDQQKNIASRIAGKIKANKFPNDDFENGYHSELLWSLLDNKSKEPIDTIVGIKESLLEIAFLLTNPDLSSKLDSYTQKNVGDHLKKLVDFFDTMRIYSNEIQYYFDYMRLKYYSASIEADELTHYIEEYEEVN